jgi:hypothetical protein
MQHSDGTNLRKAWGMRENLKGINGWTVVVVDWSAAHDMTEIEQWMDKHALGDWRHEELIEPGSDYTIECVMFFFARPEDAAAFQAKAG